MLIERVINNLGGSSFLSKLLNVSQTAVFKYGVHDRIKDPEHMRKMQELAKPIINDLQEFIDLNPDKVAFRLKTGPKKGKTNT